MSVSPDFDIIGFGTLAVDDFLYVIEYPPADGKAQVQRERRGFGGLVATALAAAVRLGARCAYAAVLGDDALSDDCLRALAAAGVRDDFIVRKRGAGPVRSTIVVEQNRGTRTIFYNSDRRRAYPSEHMTAELISRARVLIVDQTGAETMTALVKLAATLGVAVVADLESPGREGTDEFMLGISHLIVPLGFGRAITGMRDAVQVVQTLHRGVRRACTAVTCGTDGCFFATDTSDREVWHQPAFRVKTLETTGCGDVFHGAYAVALAMGKAVPECIELASAAGAAYASRPSGWEFLPGTQDLLPVLEQSREAGRHSVTSSGTFGGQEDP
jgi:sulfofructose kinase